MVNWNSVHKLFAILVLVVLLAACSSSAVETTPTVRCSDSLSLL